MFSSAEEEKIAEKEPENVQDLSVEENLSDLESGNRSEQTQNNDLPPSYAQLVSYFEKFVKNEDGKPRSAIFELTKDDIKMISPEKLEVIKENSLFMKYKDKELIKDNTDVDIPIGKAPIPVVVTKTRNSVISQSHSLSIHMPSSAKVSYFHSLHSQNVVPLLLSYLSKHPETFHQTTSILLQNLSPTCLPNKLAHLTHGTYRSLTKALHHPKDIDHLLSFIAPKISQFAQNSNSSQNANLELFTSILYFLPKTKNLTKVSKILDFMKKMMKNDIFGTIVFRCLRGEQVMREVLKNIVKEELKHFRVTTTDEPLNDHDNEAEAKNALDLIHKHLGFKSPSKISKEACELSMKENHEIFEEIMQILKYEAMIIGNLPGNQIAMVLSQFLTEEYHQINTEMRNDLLSLLLAITEDKNYQAQDQKYQFKADKTVKTALIQMLGLYLGISSNSESDMIYMICMKLLSFFSLTSSDPKNSPLEIDHEGNESSEETFDQAFIRLWHDVSKLVLQITEKSDQECDWALPAHLLMLGNLVKFVPDSAQSEILTPIVQTLTTSDFLVTYLKDFVNGLLPNLNFESKEIVKELQANWDGLTAKSKIQVLASLQVFELVKYEPTDSMTKRILENKPINFSPFLEAPEEEKELDFEPSQQEKVFKFKMTSSWNLYFIAILELDSKDALKQIEKLNFHLSDGWNQYVLMRLEIPEVLLQILINEPSDFELFTPLFSLICLVFQKGVSFSPPDLLKTWFEKHPEHHEMMLDCLNKCLSSPSFPIHFEFPKTPQSFSLQSYLNPKTSENSLKPHVYDSGHFKTFPSLKIGFSVIFWFKLTKIYETMPLFMLVDDNNNSILKVSITMQRPQSDQNKVDLYLTQLQKDAEDVKIDENSTQKLVDPKNFDLKWKLFINLKFSNGEKVITQINESVTWEKAFHFALLQNRSEIKLLVNSKTLAHTTPPSLKEIPARFWLQANDKIVSEVTIFEGWLSQGQVNHCFHSGEMNSCTVEELPSLKTDKGLRLYWRFPSRLKTVNSYPKLTKLVLKRKADEIHGSMPVLRSSCVSEAYEYYQDVFTPSFISALNVPVPSSLTKTPISEPPYKEYVPYHVVPLKEHLTSTHFHSYLLSLLPPHSPPTTQLLCWLTLLLYQNPLPSLQKFLSPIQNLDYDLNEFLLKVTCDQEIIVNVNKRGVKNLGYRWEILEVGVKANQVRWIVELSFTPANFLKIRERVSMNTVLQALNSFVHYSHWLELLEVYFYYMQDVDSSWHNAIYELLTLNLPNLANSSWFLDLDQFLDTLVLKELEAKVVVDSMDLMWLAVWMGYEDVVDRICTFGILKITFWLCQYQNKDVFVVLVKFLWLLMEISPKWKASIQKHLVFEVLISYMKEIKEVDISLIQILLNLSVNKISFTDSFIPDNQMITDLLDKQSIMSEKLLWTPTRSKLENRYELLSLIFHLLEEKQEFIPDLHCLLFKTLLKHIEKDTSSCGRLLSTDLLDQIWKYTSAHKLYTKRDEFGDENMTLQDKFLFQICACDLDQPQQNKPSVLVDTLKYKIPSSIDFFQVNILEIIFQKLPQHWEGKVIKAKDLYPLTNLLASLSEIISFQPKVILASLDLKELGGVKEAKASGLEDVYANAATLLVKTGCSYNNEMLETLNKVDFPKIASKSWFKANMCPVFLMRYMLVCKDPELVTLSLTALKTLAKDKDCFKQLKDAWKSNKQLISIFKWNEEIKEEIEDLPKDSESVLKVFENLDSIRISDSALTEMILDHSYLFKDVLARWLKLTSPVETKMHDENIKSQEKRSKNRVKQLEIDLAKDLAVKNLIKEATEKYL